MTKSAVVLACILLVYVLVSLSLIRTSGDRQVNPFLFGGATVAGLALIFLGAWWALEVMTCAGTLSIRSEFFWGGVSVLWILALWYGYFAGPSVVSIEVPVPRLAPAMDGFKMCMMSDLHAGPMVGREEVVSLVEKVNALDCGVVVLNGDVAEGTVALRDVVVQPLTQLRARHGVFFALGNHEYWNGPDAAGEWVSRMEAMGIRALVNRHALVEKDTAGFYLVGLDDLKHDPQTAVALRGLDPEKPVVVLAHNPLMIHEVSRYDVDLQLSGHCHGGQAFPLHLFVLLKQGLLSSGLYEVNRTWLYVGDGTVGSFHDRLRLGSSSEVTVVKLRSDGKPPVGD